MTIRMYRDGIEVIIDGEIKVSKTRAGHTVEKFLVGGIPKYFVTLKDTHFCAHGDTIAEAVADASWKDPSKRPSLDELKRKIQKAGRNRKITLPEFRLLTGACREGCRVALSRAKLDGSPMTAADIRDKVSKEWGDKLMNILGWNDK